MRFEIKSAPNPSHRRRATARPAWPQSQALDQCARHGPAASSKVAITTCFNLVQQDRGRDAPGEAHRATRRGGGQRSGLANRADRVLHHPQIGCHLLVRRPGRQLGAGQDDARPQGQRLAPTSPAVPTAATDRVRRPSTPDVSLSGVLGRGLSDQAVHTFGLKSLAPLVNRCHRHTDRSADHPSRHRPRLGQRQHNPAPEPHAATTRPATGRPVGRAPDRSVQTLPAPDTADKHHDSSYKLMVLIYGATH